MSIAALRICLLAVVMCATSALASAQTETVTYYHPDAIGSVRMVTDANGQVVARYDYLPFGQDVPGTPASPEPRRFGGKERDAEMAFEYFGGRYYQGQTGRFTTVDPVLDAKAALVDPQRWNRYAYVANQPLRRIDPDGRNFWDFIDILSAGQSVYEVYKDPRSIANWVGLAGDAAGAALPGVPAPSTVRRLGAVAAGAGDLGEGLRSLTRGNFRENMIRLWGRAEDGAHAHHVFPAAAQFGKDFERAGINVNDPRLGAWWSAQDHLKNARGYNQRWVEFFQQNRNPSRDQILNFGRALADEYGVATKF